MKTTLHDWLFRITLAAIFAGVIAPFIDLAPSSTTAPANTASIAHVTTADHSE